MKSNQWHNTIRKRLVQYRKECLACLYPDGDYSWGTSRKNIANTLKLVNKIVKGIPIEAWPINAEASDRVIASNNWSIKLGWEGSRRTADLSYRKDDHTAWVIEHSKKPGSGVFVDFDIGGS